MRDERSLHRCDGDHGTDEDDRSELGAASGERRTPCDDADEEHGHRDDRTDERAKDSGVPDESVQCVTPFCARTRFGCAAMFWFECFTRIWSDAKVSDEPTKCPTSTTGTPYPKS